MTIATFIARAVEPARNDSLCLKGDAMTHWFIEPIWQNYSSMYREAVMAHEAMTGMEIAHHRMAALYFGISALESFLNLKMRDHLLRTGKNHEEIHKELVEGRFKTKIKKWPLLITGVKLNLRPGSIERIMSINALRGELTHQKNFWPEAYEELSQTDPMDAVDLVAEFIIEFHRASGEFFPYWVWGWNYLNPQRDAHEIILLNNTQIMHSLNYLGYRFPPGTRLSFEDRQKRALTDYAGYTEIARFLRASEKCEPKIEGFPYQPKLCRRWWDLAHQHTCGNVSEEAIRRALEVDAQYGRSEKSSAKKLKKTGGANSVMRAISHLFGSIR